MSLTSCLADYVCKVEEHGFAILPDLLLPEQVEQISRALAAALGNPHREGAISTSAGTVYAARNVLALWPSAADVWRVSPLPEVLATVLGPRFGLVRVLFFDKPPQDTWALPWHKDLTIAVRDNHLPSSHFTHPTRKAGVPHVEAPEAVLREMLTVRFHLDAATPANGPLKVIPGSHRTGKDSLLGDVAPQSILTGAGASLLMRPLLAHSSGRSDPDTDQHRRVLHFEFAGSPELPDGYAWHTFLPGRSVPIQQFADALSEQER